MLDINNYLLQYKRKLPNLKLMWFVVLVFMLVFVGIINSNFRLKDYYKTKGIVREGLLVVPVSFDNVKDLVSSKFIYLDDNEYSYKIIEINDDFIQEGNEIYQNIFLSIETKGKRFIDNQVFEIKFVIKEMTILEYIYCLFKGE